MKNMKVISILLTGAILIIAEAVSFAVQPFDFQGNLLRADGVTPFTSEVVSTRAAQALSNKTLNESNTITGEAIKYGTINDARLSGNVAMKNSANNFGAYDQTFDTNTFVINSASHTVGIGTLSSLSRLTVNGTIEGEGDQYFRDATLTSPIKLSELAGWFGSVTRIKLLPGDFHSDDGDDNMTPDTQGRYTRASSGTTQGVATIAIPTGFKAIAVMVYGSDATNSVDVYENSITDETTASSRGSGTVGTEIDITDTDSSQDNYLSIYVNTGNGDRINGGYVSIQKI